jgi:dihydroorotate dehydrogenase (fumarate)
MSVDLSTTYLGILLKNPLVASASPLSRTVEGVRQLEDAGASAIVLHSLFAEQILMADYPYSPGVGSVESAPSYFPRWDRDPIGPDGYLDEIRLAKRSVDIPIIASLNGTSPGEWLQYARYVEEAGADALELNLYSIPTDPHLTGEAVEQRHLDFVREIRGLVQIPLAVKIGPFYSSLPNMAHRLVEAGADGLVLFNRFYQPDLDLETLRPVMCPVLSNSGDLHLPLRWIALLYGTVSTDFALTGGIHTYRDVLKALFVGANVTMLASELLEKGPDRIGELLREVSRWMEQHGPDCVARMRGQAKQFSAADPAAFERASYTKAILSLDPAKTVSQRGA